MEQINIERCCKALENLNIEGAPRADAIADAIENIQKHPTGALMTNYIGVKNYAGFGDQREDHEYGMGPRHGSIVFRIERTRMAREKRIALGEDEIYLLECYRDFGTANDPSEKRSPYEQQVQMTLTKAIKEWQLSDRRAAALRTLLEAARVDTHEVAAVAD